MFPDLSSSNLIALDTETSGLDQHNDFVVGFVITWSPRPEDSIYLPIRHKGGGNLPNEKGVINCVRQLCKRTDLTVVMHNAAFDLMMLYKENIHVEGFVEDTGITAALIDENMKSFSLSGCCEYFGVQAKRGDEMYAHLEGTLKNTYKRPQDQMAHFWELSGDDPVAVGYAVGDGTSTFQLREAQEAHLDHQELRRVWEVECNLIKPLHRAKMRGIRVNVSKLSQVQEEIENTLAEAQAEIDFINTGSGKEIKKFLAKHAEDGVIIPPGIKTAPSKMYPDGQDSYPSKWLDKFPLGAKIAIVKKLMKMASGFITPLVDKHLVGDIVYPSFSQTKGDDFGTVTGRMSSYSPNMQQIHKKDKVLGRLFRQVFLPPEGMEWWEIDYKGAEYRLFAHTSQSQKLIDGFNLHGLDMHDVVAEMLGVSRDFAKNMNFGLLFGMGGPALAGHLGVTLAEAKAYKRQYFELIPEAKTATDRASRICIEHGYMKTLLGRRRRWLNPRDKSYQALNAYCQGGVGDIIKMKIFEVEKYLMEQGEGLYGFPIHDANEFFVPIGNKEIPAEVIRISEDFSNAPFKNPLRVGMPVDQGHGLDWALATYGEEMKEAA